MAAAGAGGLGAVGARAVFAGVDEFLGGITRIGAELSAFAGAGGGLGRTNDRLAEVSQGFGVFNAAVAATGAAVGAVTGTISTITAPIRLIGSAATSAATEVVEGGGKIVGALKDVGDSLVDISEKGALGFGAVGGSIVALATTAVTESAKFQRGMKDIGAVAQVNAPDLDVLDSAIRRVGVNFPASIGNIQRSALELSKAGVPIKDISTSILDLTVATEQLSTGELSAEQAAEAIGSNLKLFARSFEESGDSVEKQAARIINSIQAIANSTRASSSEVISAITKLGPNLAVLGSSIEQTAALSGLVVAQGPRGQEAGTALANLFQRLENPSRESAKILQRRPQLNLFDAQGDARPAIDVIKSFQDTYGAALRTKGGIDGMSQAMATAELAELVQTRSLRTLNLVLGLSTQEYTDFLDKIQETDALGQAAEQNTALIRQLEILRNNAVLAGVAFGRDFVEGLGSATTGLNAFLSDAERAQSIAGTIGKSTAAILTQSGQDNARANLNDSPIGSLDNLRIFDTLNAGAERTRDNLEKLIDDSGHLAETLGRIAFPDGVVGAIDGSVDGLNTIISTGDLVVRKFDEITPTIVADLQQITGAATFDELITNAQSFAGRLGKTFTENNGDQSLKNANDASASFLSNTRREADPTATSVAKLLRQIEDVSPALLRLAEIGVSAFAAVTRSVLELTTAILGLINLPTEKGGALGEQAANIVDNFVKPIAGAVGRGLADRGNLTTDTEASRFDARNGLGPRGIPNRDPSLAGGGINPTPANPIQGPLEIIPARDAVGGGGLTPGIPDPHTQFLQGGEDQVATLEAMATAADDAATAQDNLENSTHSAADEIGKTTGAANLYAQELRDIEAAQKAFDNAVKSLGSSMRTLDKDTVDVGGAFDKTVAGARERWIDGMDQIAVSTQDTVTRLRRSASEARDKALEGFNLQTARGGGFAASLDENGQLQVDLSSSIAGFNTLFQRFQQDQKLIFSQGQQDRATLRSQAAENDTQEVGRHNQDLERIESQSQEAQTRARQQGIEARELIRQRAEQDELTAFSRGQDTQLTAFTRGQDAQNTARLRSREDQRASEQLGRDLGSAATPADRTRILTAFTESRRVTAQQRQDQNDDTKYSQTQQDTLTRFRQTQEESLTKFRRTQEDGDIDHRRELEVQDITFRRLLEVDMIRFRRDLEDKETQRRRIAAALEVAQQRRDALQAQGFDRGQGDQATLFNNLNEQIPNLQRQLRDIDTQETNGIQSAAENAAKEILRTSLTAQRGITAGQATGEEALRRLQERFTVNAANLLERTPESKRPELQQQINQQQAVLSAQIALAQARNRNVGGSFSSEIDQATQGALSQLGGIVPNISTLQEIFGTDAASSLVTTSLLATPQVDRLTRALENLTTKIDQVKPGVNIDTVEQTITVPPGTTVTPATGLATVGSVL